VGFSIERYRSGLQPSVFCSAVFMGLCPMLV
jgi:hypothetical protein